jgi:hypothetical protein
MRVRNQMAADLERLLNQKEEMSMMKQIVLNMSDRREKPTCGPRTPRTKPAHGTFDHPEENVQKPGAHIFVSTVTQECCSELRDLFGEVLDVPLQIQ